MRKTLLKNVILVQEGNVDDSVIESTDTRKEREKLFQPEKQMMRLIALKKKFKSLATSSEKDKEFLPALWDVPEQTFLKETAKTAKVDKVLGAFKIYSIIEIKMFICVGTVVVTNRFGKDKKERNKCRGGD